MSPRQVELTLKKQRLQMRSGILRDDLAAFAGGLKPAFALADRGRSALRWLRGHPLVLVAAGVALLTARPRAVLRWAQRGFFGWQALRKVSSIIQLALSRSR